ncbi:glycosyltransferase family 2 protein [Paenibacillus planticolens]|nr:glycosyltransferase [Paenibacillus planticolens]
MKHSIVVPVNQDFNILTLFTESLMKSVCPSTQIIFINDGSGQKVQELLERLQREAPAGVAVEIIRHEYPRGCAVSINEALSTVTGDYIYFLDSDIILNLKFQEQMEATLNSSPTIGMAGGVLLYPQTGGIQHCGITFADTIGRHLFLNATLEDIPQEIFNVQMVVFAMFAMKREVFEKVGYLDEKFFNGYEDFDYQMRAKAAGYSTVINPEIRAYHWERSSGIHRSFNRKNNLARFWKKWGNDIQSDIWDFTFSNLKSRLSSNKLKQGLTFTGIDLAEVRSDADAFWDHLRKSGLVSLTDVYDYSSRFQSNGAIWLPQVLGKELIHSSSRLLFLVDNFTRLLDNRYWIEIRRNVSSEDLIIDLYGNVVMINQIYESCWPGTKVR